MENIGYDGVAFLVCLAFMIADYVTGTAKAAMRKELSSTALRAGLWHKAGFVGALALAIGCEQVSYLGILPDGFAGLYVLVAAYIVYTEAVSVFENLCAINPELAKSPLGRLLSESEEN